MQQLHPDPAVQRLLSELKAQGVAPELLAHFASQTSAIDIARVLFGAVGSDSASDLDQLHAVSLLAGSIEANYFAQSAAANPENTSNIQHQERSCTGR